MPSPQYDNIGSNEKEMSETADFLIIAHDVTLFYKNKINLLIKHETRFYEHFPSLEPKAKLPKYYYGAAYHPTHKEGLILMEDLSSIATSIPVLPGFNEPQLFALLEEVAKIHSASWRFPQWQQLIGTLPIRLFDDYLLKKLIYRQGFLDEMIKNAYKLIEV